MGIQAGELPGAAVELASETASSSPGATGPPFVSDADAGEAGPKKGRAKKGKP